MPPRKRKPALAPIIEQEAAADAAPASAAEDATTQQQAQAGAAAAAPPPPQQQQQQAVNQELAAIVHEKIREIDRAGKVAVAWRRSLRAARPRVRSPDAYFGR
jgi:hypothetical protein